MVVAWPSLTDGQFERFVALLLHQGRPHSWRRRPDKGDKGIDFLNPIDEEWETFQIKFFPGSLTSSRKAKIAESLKTFRANLDRPIRSWDLVLPQDKTDKSEAWFAELTTDCSFPCEWRGETFLDDLAARHPHVIDYCLGDGRRRLERQLKEWREVLDDPGPVMASAAEDRLRSLSQAIDAHDPYDEYFFSVTPSSPPTSMFDGCVMTRTLAASDGRFVTIAVRPRFPQALADRPIPIRALLAVRNERRAVLEDAFEFGRPVTLLGGEIERLEIDAPGGLGHIGSGGELKIGAGAGEAAAYVLRVAVVEPDGAIVASLLFDMDPATRGPAGVAMSGSFAGGVLRCEGRLRTSGMGYFNITIGVFEGATVADVLAASEFIDVLRPPNQLKFGGPHGALARTGFEVPSDGPVISTEVLTVFRELASLQEWATDVLRVPPGVSRQLRSDIHRAAELIAGNRVTGQWTSVNATIDPTRAPEDLLDGAAHQVMIQYEPTITIEDVTVAIGLCSMHLPRVRLSEPVSADQRSGPIGVTLVPDGDAPYVIYPPVR